MRWPHSGVRYNKVKLNPYIFPKGTKLVSWTIIRSLRGDWLRIRYILPGEDVRETTYGWYDKQNGKWPIRPSLRAFIRGLLD